MGYDMRLVKTYNHCDFCKRHDEDWLESYWYMSYNHGWAFYKWLDDEKGITDAVNFAVENGIFFSGKLYKGIL